MRSVGVLLTVFLAISAGCLAGQPEAADAVPTDALEPADGSIAGIVVDDEFRAVGGAQVVVDGKGLSAMTGADGTFAFDPVPAGANSVVALKEGYEVGRADVTVEPATSNDVEIRLRILPSYAPHNLTTILEGKFDCAHEIPIWTGDCFILYNEFIGPHAGNESFTEEKHAFPLEIGERWQTVLLEMVWDKPATNQLDGMRLYLEKANITSEGHSYKIARTDGPVSPLTLQVDRGIVHETADVYPGTETPVALKSGGEQALVRVFPRGQFYETSSQVCDSDGRCFLGVGAGLDIKFTVYATIFYNAPPPEGFTAIPAS